MQKRIIVALAAVLALAAACTGGGGEGPSPTASPTPEPWRGGTLRLAVVQDAFSDLDPQVGLSPLEMELFRCCLLRTIFSYNGLPTAEGGSEARPDLAAGAPEVSADGRTWTIRIKPGIHYAPPLEDVEITAQDFVRALMREAVAEAGYGYYYSIIQGFDAYAGGDADTISGLETPDEHTLVVRLSEPAGDLPDRFALAATAPIPPSPYRPDAVMGAADGHEPNPSGCIQRQPEGRAWVSCGYGHWLVSSGPYMIAGSEDLDLSLPPEDQAPTAGFTTPGYVKPAGEPWTVAAPGSLTLVRNPSWDPATDDLRAAYADRIEVQLRGAHALPPDLHASTVDELVAAVDSATVDHVPDLPYTPRQIRGYLADPSMEGCVTSAPTGVINYIFLNLAMPPFDDLHVRRAVAFAIDETAILRAMETGLHVGPEGSVATHLAPDSTEGDLLAGFDPYPTSLERAREEMALSRYDGDGDGRCDVPACEDVLALAREEALGPEASGQVAASLRRIGIDLSVETLTASAFYPRVSDERGKVPISMGLGWIWAYPNASTVLPDLFASSNIPGGGYNSSLLGATSSQLREWGYDVTEVPSADDRIERCTAMTASAQTECWAELDRYLMEDVVPAIPYLAPESTFVVSERVASYSHSRTTTYLAFDRIALLPGSQ